MANDDVKTSFENAIATKIEPGGSYLITVSDVDVHNYEDFKQLVTRVEEWYPDSHFHFVMAAHGFAVQTPQEVVDARMTFVRGDAPDTAPDLIGWRFYDATVQRILDEKYSVTGKIEALMNLVVGAASNCWERDGGNGVFDSIRARIISEEAKNIILELTVRNS